MPTYIGLLNWTDRGIENFRESPQRAETAAAAAQQVGANLRETYWTVGPYDLVAVVEAPDDETVTAFLLAVGSQGNVRTTTLRAFDREEFEGIIEKLPPPS
jgi:uncharacterized protein with GYD domain